MLHVGLSRAGVNLGRRKGGLLQDLKIEHQCSTYVKGLSPAEVHLRSQTNCVG